MIRATLGLLLLTATPILAAEPGTKPNIIFLLADDLGLGDVGCFGQTKIRTPNIDQLAHEGLRLTTHYSGNAVCAPSRCVLMTGYHPGHTFIRSNRQYRPQGEGQYPIPAETVTLPKLLKKAGYVTGAFGKWGLGAPGTCGAPENQGIDRFFGYNCQGVAHNYYPTHLWDHDQRLALKNPPFAAHQKFPADADPKNPDSYKRYQGTEYAPDLISAQALRFIRDNKDRPFFLFYPTTVPHLALQIPEDSLREYAGKFEETPYLGGRYLPNRTPHATYAAMITRLDREIGRMIDTVKELGLEQNTIFVFTSDNGPLYDQLGGTDTEFFNSAAGLRGRKGSLYEGGIRVPGIIRWTGQIAAGTESARITGFEDWMPTLLELAGLQQSTPATLDGISFAPTLKGKPQPARSFLYREFPGYGGQQSVRVENWKAIRQDLNPGAKQKLKPGAIALYDLSQDPRETRDIAAAHPDIVQKLAQLLKSQHTRSELFPIRALDGDR
ncbi:MAG: arylsulfatase [Bacteroidales bacterium]|nr:arylsulfatase [Bacteroidales bacterium]